ncbi:unnamed protein product [Tilletia controversa]|uniref:Very-long-chain (3R)-3-hydroxyacyl-CoA dehydratase n=3 Tax=Tilletia TaxID=13289 RepID=A0A8X7MXY5_9BASI|nr:hypothetical protein CF336_g1171 [Tilletia laevis]KAE8204878.1 hypothetical protein CF328_g824 [Tilletia controversa]KAE8263884.1 hypothetical protein A4X03_0g1353 [Tilletia caries]KAE8207425.1 hypothetical protein CF335_g1152 [Tilletia laevis]KAE8252332.1 hypothetical protein A4X06_0g2270 [Tilletia controversa]
MSQPSAPKPPRRSSAGSELIRYYLIAYNFASFFGWSLILFSLLKHVAIGPQTPTAVHRFAEFALRNLNLRPLRMLVLPTFAQKLPAPLLLFLMRAATAQQSIGSLVGFVQSFAILEVVHAALGWVRSPVPTTAIQVGSRLFSVWGVAERYASASVSPWYGPMVLAWSLTECVRYPFYAQQLLKNESPFLLWARYSLFFVLYPLGAISEAMLIKSTLPSGFPWQKSEAWDARASVYAGLFLFWWYGLYVMYTYMIKQRKKALGTGFFGSNPAGQQAQRKVKEAPHQAAAIASSVQIKAQEATKRR